MQCADLYLVVADLECHRVGRLCLLTSQFGSGFLLDRRHPNICPRVLGLGNAACASRHATQLLSATKPRWVNCVAILGVNPCGYSGYNECL